MYWLLKIYKFLRIIGLFPHKMRSRHNSGHLVCRPHAAEGRRKVSHIGSFSPLILSVTIVYQLLSVPLYATLLMRNVQALKDSNNAIDAIGHVAWKSIYITSCLFVNVFLIFKNFELVKIYNLLLSIRSSFNENAVKSSLIPRYRIILSLIIFTFNLSQNIGIHYYSMSIMNLISSLKGDLADFACQQLTEHIFWYIAQTYREIVNENGRIFLEKIIEKPSLGVTEDDPSSTSTIDNFSHKKEFKPRNREDNSFTSTVALETEMFLKRVNDIVELTMETLGYLIIFKLMVSIPITTANIYYIIRRLGDSSASDLIYKLTFLTLYISVIVMYATLSGIVNEEVGI